MRSVAPGASDLDRRATNTVNFSITFSLSEKFGSFLSIVVISTDPGSGRSSSDYKMASLIENQRIGASLAV